MKPLFAFAFILLLQFSFGQRRYPPDKNIPAQISFSQVNFAGDCPTYGEPTYDVTTCDKKLKSARRLTISGATLTAAGGAVFVAGVACLFIPHPRNPDGHKTTFGNGILAIACWCASAPVLAAGIPTLITGELRRKKWTRIKEQISVHAGLLDSGNAGMGLSF